MKKLNKGIIAKKIGMTMFFEKNDAVSQVTVLEVLENIVVQKKIESQDGYSALKIGYKEIDEKKKDHKLDKAHIGQLKELNRFFRKFAELRLVDIDKYNIGDNVKLDLFEVDEKVNVTGVTKGRGFSGTVKRHNFSISPMSHGSKNHRRQGTIGAGTGQGKVWKGQKMPGRYGVDNVTVKNLKIVKIFLDKNLIMIKGSVPGCNGGIIKIYN